MSPVPTRELFPGGPVVSAIGISLSAPPGSSQPVRDLAILAPASEDPAESGENRSVKLIREAISLGVSFIDSDWITANGHNQEILGRSLLGIARESVFISSKGGPRLDFHGRLMFDNSRANLMNQCQDSLFRLKLEHVDLMQVHWPDATPAEQTAKGLGDLVHAGKSHLAGVCNYTAEGLKELYSHTDIKTVQVGLSMLQRCEYRSLKEFCAESGIGIIATDPFCGGLLCDRYDGSEQFPDEDRQGVFSEASFPRAVAFVSELASFAGTRGVSVSQLAVAWCLGEPGVSCVLCRIDDGISLAETAAAAGVILTESDRSLVDEMLSRHDLPTGR